MPVDVGRGGEDDVSVVARRVGLNFLEVACGENAGSIDGVTMMSTQPGREDVNGTDRALFDEAVVPKIFEHCFLSGA